MQIRAFSKINLFLEVVGKRSDGYHNLRSVMQSLSLHDMITVKTEPPANGGASIHISCNNPILPTDKRNLVTRAVNHIAETYNISESITVHIEKKIPVSAGLGGGSSDCAATLLALNRLLALNLSRATLCEIGLRFGADVPFCITGGTALAEGVGEILTPLPPHPPCWIVLACLPVAVSTAKIFKRYNAAEHKIPTYPSITEMTGAIMSGDAAAVAQCFHNDLTPVTASFHPEINELIYIMKQHGAMGSAMSGSGPSVFGYFAEKSTAQKTVNYLKKSIRNVYLVKPERTKSP